MTEEHEDQSKGWADGAAFRKGLVIVLALAAITVAIAGFLPQFRKDHPHFAVEGFGAFFAIYGFAAFMFIVLVGQHLRKLVGREETYYEDRE
jgi:threonine/homoserine/homoserine lactone efflux protein